MLKSLKPLIVLIALIAIVVALRPFFIVPEGEQTVITRFGKIVNIHTEAGLKFKIPLIDMVTRYSKKILSWDGDPQRMPTSENQYIWVDTTARWHIINPGVFYQRVNIMDEAYARLDNVIESAVRTVVSQYPLTESVRSTNKILESSNTLLDFQRDENPAAAANDSDTAENGKSILENAFAPINMGREALSSEMFSRSQHSMPEYGIELIDVVIRQIRYSDDLTKSVYDRMISERRKVATGYRSDGNGLKAEWLGRLNRDRDIKLTEAETQAAIIRSEGDAEAARIYADAYNADPEFYSFWKALETYQKVLPGQRKILSTGMDFFDYLYNME